jgi:glycosyltransferase involved in cell wall biosynthesis
MNRLAIVMTTYNRPQTAVPTLQALACNLRFDGSVSMVIADDGSPEGYVRDLLQHVPAEWQPQTTCAERKGVGHSKNLGLELAYTKADVVLLMEDDWVLKQATDITPYYTCLCNDRDGIGMIRLGWLSHDISARLTKYGELLYWDLVPGSGLYGCSGQVGLRHRRFYDVMGWHSLRCSPGEEELDMCHRWNRMKKPKILWPAHVPIGLGEGVFANNGMGCSLNRVVPSK